MLITRLDDDAVAVVVVLIVLLSLIGKLVAAISLY